jgi:type IV pilus assembly protein PilA
MNRKGFTLIELLAMLVVLGILMTVAIPNIAGILNNQKKNSLKSDITTMVETAKVKVAKGGTIKKPKDGECIVFSLNYLNDNDNIEKGPNGGNYEQYDSFVIYARSRNGTNIKYEYYIRLIENNEDGKYYYGIELENINNIDGKIKKISKNNYQSIGLSNTSTESQLNSNSTISSLCPRGVIKYYTRKEE